MLSTVKLDIIKNETINNLIVFSKHIFIFNFAAYDFFLEIVCTV